MTTYVFNFKAIAIVPEARHANTTGIWSVRAANFEDAYERAYEHFKTNKQFRFEYEYAGKGQS